MPEDWPLRLAVSVVIALVIFAGLVLALLEHATGAKPYTAERRTDVVLSLSTILPNAVVYFVMAPWWGFIYHIAASSAFTLLPVSTTTILLALLASDLSYYVEHRCAHRLGLLWRGYHGTHHTGEIYHVPLAYRVNPLNHFVAPIFYVPWIIVGVPPLLVVGGHLFVFHYQVWLHTEKIGSLSVLDRWFNTPAAHRLHHDRSCARGGVNFGAVTLWWDRLFGTYCPPREVTEYGIDGVGSVTTLLGLYVDPWRRIDLTAGKESVNSRSASKVRK